MSFIIIRIWILCVDHHLFFSFVSFDGFASMNPCQKKGETRLVKFWVNLMIIKSEPQSYRMRKRLAVEKRETNRQHYFTKFVSFVSFGGCSFDFHFYFRIKFVCERRKVHFHVWLGGGEKMTVSSGDSFCETRDPLFLKWKRKTTLSRFLSDSFTTLTSGVCVAFNVFYVVIVTYRVNATTSWERKNAVDWFGLVGVCGGRVVIIFCWAEVSACLSYCVWDNISWSDGI